LICAGGTGGGVYPALAILEALKMEDARLETLWVGGEGGMEARLVERVHVPFQAIPAAGVHGVSLRRLPGNAARLARGIAASRLILRSFRPDVLLFTGGYVAVPMALAGRRVPTVLYVPDIEPGLALKTLALFADGIAVTTDESRQYFARGKAVVTGYPVRPDLAGWTRSKARKCLGLAAKGRVLLILGGSKGARSINRAVQANLPALLEMAEVVHITGDADWEALQAVSGDLPAWQASRYHAHPYLHEEMGAALAAADLVISRAGASALGEYPLFGLPAILVPYPYAWRYQKVNAAYLQERGAALMIEDSHLQADLAGVVKGLLENPARLESMQDNMRALARPEAARQICRLVMQQAGRRS
jgi:UDP-N-acetylglucosamine--N-acetylmuramyl-(pentapeptide) pyrophosphoryl-undecaprenol N-acetylglucosamine transferase